MPNTGSVHRRNFQRQVRRRDKERNIQKAPKQEVRKGTTLGDVEKSQARRAEARNKGKELSRDQDLMDQQRRDQMLQQHADRNTMRGVASGHTDPREAMGRMGERGREELMMARPEVFGVGGGAPGAGGGGGGGAGGGGVPGGAGAPPGLKYADRLAHYQDPSTPIPEAAMKYDDGKPVPEHRQAHEAARMDMEAGREFQQGFDPPQQGMQGPLSMPEARARAQQKWQEDRAHFDETLVTSYVDAEGNPVDASRAGEEGVHQKFTHQGANTGERIVGKPDRASIGSVGFGDRQQSATERAISMAFGEAYRGDNYQRGRATNVGREDQAGSRGDTGDKAGQSDTDRPSGPVSARGKTEQELGFSPPPKKQFGEGVWNSLVKAWDVAMTTGQDVLEQEGAAKEQARITGLFESLSGKQRTAFEGEVQRLVKEEGVDMREAANRVAKKWRERL